MNIHKMEVAINISYFICNNAAKITETTDQKYFVCAVLSRLVMSDSATPWTVTCQAPLSMGILEARILEWVAMPSSRGIFPIQGSNLRLLCLLRWQAGFSTTSTTWEALRNNS